MDRLEEKAQRMQGANRRARKRNRVTGLLGVLVAVVSAAALVSGAMALTHADTLSAFVTDDSAVYARVAGAGESGWTRVDGTGAVNADAQLRLRVAFDLPANALADGATLQMRLPEELSLDGAYGRVYDGAQVGVASEDGLVAMGTARVEDGWLEVIFDDATVEKNVTVAAEPAAEAAPEGDKDGAAAEVGADGAEVEAAGEATDGAEAVAGEAAPAAETAAATGHQGEAVQGFVDIDFGFDSLTTGEDGTVVLVLNDGVRLQLAKDVVEPAVEEPVADEPAAEEPATDEPAAEEPATDEPATGDPATDEQTADDPAAEEPATDEPATDEPATTDQNTATLTASAPDGTSVTATYAKGTLPEGATLSVETPDAQKQAQDVEAVQGALEDGKTVVAAYPYSITFAKDGQEVEPTGDVQVVLDFSGAASRQDGVEWRLYHITDDGQVEEVTPEEAALALTMVNDQTVGAAEFTADSFSDYVLMGVGDGATTQDAVPTATLTGDATGTAYLYPSSANGVFSQSNMAAFSGGTLVLNNQDWFNNNYKNKNGGIASITSSDTSKVVVANSNDTFTLTRATLAKTDSVALTINYKDGTHETFNLDGRLPAGKYGDCTLTYNTQKDAFTGNSAYSKYYNPNEVLGVAGNFHLVGFDTVTLTTHTNGNILANHLVANVNFGTNNYEELSYVQHYDTVNSGSESLEKNVLVVGSDSVIGLADNNSRFTVNGTKLDRPKNLVVDDDTTSAPFIDMNALYAESKNMSTALGGVPQQGVTDDHGTQTRTVTINDPDGAGYWSVKSTELETLPQLDLKGFQEGHVGSLVINVDCEGRNYIKLPEKATMYIGDQAQSWNEVTDFKAGKIIWNFVNAPDNLVIDTKLMTGIVLAPDYKVVVTQNLNGTVIAKNIEIKAESHRTDFTGTVVPATTEFTAAKTVNGNTPKLAETFKFVREQLVDGHWQQVDTVQNVQGKVPFSQLSYTTTGTYWYRLREADKAQQAEAIQDKYDFSTDQYLVNVVVTKTTKDGTETFSADVHKYKVTDAEHLLSADGTINRDAIEELPSGTSDGAGTGSGSGDGSSAGAGVAPAGMSFSNSPKSSSAHISVNKSWTSGGSDAATRAEGYTVHIKIYRKSVDEKPSAILVAKEGEGWETEPYAEADLTGNTNWSWGQDVADTYQDESGTWHYYQYAAEEVQVTDGAATLTANKDYTPGAATFSAAGTQMTVTMTNELPAEYSLPKTGGAGAWPFVLVGVALAGVAALARWRVTRPASRYGHSRR